MKTKEERRAKKRASNAAWHAANPEKAHAYDVAWRARNREKIRAYDALRRAEGKDKDAKRKKQYGLSPGAFQLMLLGQKSACAICKGRFLGEPYVDHDHATGEVRGLLCRRCNIGLGHFKDRPDFLESAKEYLLGR